MPRIKDQAICIRHLDWSETSQIVVLLTAGHGKVRGIAKGSKRFSPSSVARFSGGIELLTRGQVVATMKPTAELAALTEWDLQDDFHDLRRDLAAQRVGLYAADVCHAMLADHDAHARTFEALAGLLRALAKPGDPASGFPGFRGNRGSGRFGGALLGFQWAVLDDGGYRPELWRDVVTGGALPERAVYTFDAQAGGLTVKQSGRAEGGKVEGRGPGRRGRWGVRAETVRLLRAVAEAGDNATPAPAGVEVEVGATERANRLLCVYLRTILDRELPTMRFVLDSSHRVRQ